MNRRDRLMLMIATVLLGGIVFKFEIYDPQQAQHTTLVAARDAAADELARDERIVARAPQARAEYERARAHIAAVEQKLPQQKEIPALLTAMEQFTKNVGVVFQSIRPGPLSAVALPPGAAQASPAGAQGQTRPGQHPPVYSSMPVELSLSGTFEQTVAYLRGLKNFPRLVIIDSVSLTPQVLPKLSVTIKAEIYTLGTPQAPAGGAR